MKKYDIFLFDADGTLFDYDKAEENALKTTFANCGFKYSENIRSKYREINSRAWKSYERNEITKEQLQTLRFANLFNETGICYDAKDFNGKYLHELGRGSFLIDGALEICEEIASNNKLIYVVTNGILATQKSRIENSIISKYISDFFVSEFVGFQKPHISYFNYIFEHIPKAGKEKIMIIGDSLSADIAGGNNAGIDSCWFNKSGVLNDTDIKPAYEISSLYELRNFI
jgi:YjjG family noncanonical pyrimidine nucleotidase